MKKIIFFMILYFLFVSIGYTCGTIESWTEEFLQASGDKATQINRLSMIQCEPVVKNSYNGSRKQHELLGKMIESALRMHDECAWNMALKDFLLFENLKQIKDSPMYNGISKQLTDYLGRSLEEIHGDVYLYDWQNANDYCALVKKEIDSLRQTGTISCSPQMLCYSLGTMITQDKIEKSYPKSIEKN